MRGIVRFAGYLPYRRLDRAAIPGLLGSGGGRGTRAVASHDEDTTTMGVEALRAALGPGLAERVGSLWFATASPAYLDKTNAVALAAASGLPFSIGAYDVGGSLRSGVGALLACLAGSGHLSAVVMADMRDGLPAGTDESAGGDAAAAFLVGEDGPDTPVVAGYLGGASVSEEFLDRWRAPGERRSRTWEERFGETRYLDLGHDAWEKALAATGICAGDVTRVAVTGMHARAVSGLTRKLGVAPEAIADDLCSTVGQAGCAHPGLVLASMLEGASPGDTVALVHLADGADVLFFRVTAAIGEATPPRRLDASPSAPVPYGKYLAWRGMITTEPPRRPEPARVSSSAAWRSNGWKYGFTGSQDRSSEAVHLPPARVSMRGGAFDDMVEAPRASVQGTIVTFTIDRLAYSPSPPIVFAVVDFDGGGRFPLELTDCDEADVAIGGRVEMTFRRLFTADGIHDYFWKARLLRSGVVDPPRSIGGPR